MPTIYVSRNGQSFNLKLRDSQGHNPGNNNLTTDADPGNEITWVLDTDSGLTAITGIKKSDPAIPKYKDSIEVLTGDPTLVNGVWTGFVKSPSPGKGKFQNYMIGFTVPGDTNTYWDDPKIQMKS
ncbi:hypothetical protein [Flavihumibacter profundi]|uniref:hypothetical protein n=1 Tax=Flavihumibacter profundi TaxID=2716883 RepID=UPI001CC39A70|nr:hypothetical protein [Flavihumibacter profundi]MBZ5855517.1 hypothetical protein [Flavihumibacter profundi]